MVLDGNVDEDEKTGDRREDDTTVSLSDIQSVNERQDTNDDDEDAEGAEHDFSSATISDAGHDVPSGASLLVGLKRRTSQEEVMALTMMTGWELSVEFGGAWFPAVLDRITEYGAKVNFLDENSACLVYFWDIEKRVKRTKR
jgi:hypothetical protein